MNYYRRMKDLREDFEEWKKLSKRFKTFRICGGYVKKNGSSPS